MFYFYHITHYTEGFREELGLKGFSLGFVCQSYFGVQCRMWISDGLDFIMGGGGGGGEE